jgi:histidinol-phosphate/aromatic aminotransferase/cobyric acid decarboxylase-like protein
MTELDRRQALALALGLAAVPLRARDADAPLQYPIRLSFNENPWGPGPKARAAIVESLVDGSRYGAEYATRLTAAIAAHEAVATERIILNCCTCWRCSCTNKDARSAVHGRRSAS